MTPNVNVLVAAFRADHPHHRTAARWLQEALKSSQPLALVPLVAASFLRLVTNAKVFLDPAPIVKAIAFLDALLEHPRAQWVAAQDEWSALKALCLEHRLSGNGLPDAWLAATVLKVGEHLVTFDAGFRKLLPRRQLTIVSI